MTALLTPALAGQIINLLAAVLLLLSFAMLAQRRIRSLIDLFAAQGFVLALSTAFVAYATGQSHLYWSAGMTLVLKVCLLPWILHRLIRRLDVKWDVETLINIPTTMLVGIVLVILAFNLAQPVSQLAGTVTRAPSSLTIVTTPCASPAPRRRRACCRACRSPPTKSTFAARSPSRLVIRAGPG